MKKERGVISEDGEYPPPEDKGGNRFTPWWYKTQKISDPSLFFLPALVCSLRILRRYDTVYTMVLLYLLIAIPEL